MSYGPSTKVYISLRTSITAGPFTTGNESILASDCVEGIIYCQCCSGWCCFRTRFKWEIDSGVVVSETTTASLIYVTFHAAIMLSVVHYSKHKRIIANPALMPAIKYMLSAKHIGGIQPQGSALHMHNLTQKTPRFSAIK